MTPSSLQIDTKHNCIVVTRLIRYKLHKIEFNLKTEGQHLVPYFNMTDDDFLKYSRR